jgi:hypothetical protein
MAEKAALVGAKTVKFAYSLPKIEASYKKGVKSGINVKGRERVR